jgi:hypothetical protein
MATWEYKVVSLEAYHEPEDVLNNLGQDRWELIAIATQDGEPLAYLKREAIYATSSRGEPKEVVSHIPEVQPMVYVTVRVSAKDDPAVVGWVDTGVDVGDDNVGLSFSISGDVRESSGEWIGPEGRLENLALNPAIGQDLPSGCLVAMVGEQGTVELLDTSGFLPTTERGRLYLAINDSSYEHNDGEYSVAVTVM